MKKTLFVITLAIGQTLFSQSCESLKKEIILESNKKLATINIEQILSSLKVCGLDEAEIEIITNQTFFIGTMNE